MCQVGHEMDMALGAAGEAEDGLSQHCTAAMRSHIYPLSVCMSWGCTLLTLVLLPLSPLTWTTSAWPVMPEQTCRASEATQRRCRMLSDAS